MSQGKSRPRVIVAVLIVGMIAGSGATLLALLAPGGVPPYMSSCVIKSNWATVSVVYKGERPGRPTPDINVVRERMLRYEAVMEALAGTDLMREVERQCADKPELRARLKNELHKRVVRNTQIELIGTVLVKVTYRDKTPERAFTVLQKMVYYFIENVFANEFANARYARDFALAHLTRAKETLESIKNQLSERARAEPGLQKELSVLERDKAAAAEEHAEALAIFHRVDKEFNETMAGLLVFNIITPPRRPTKKSPGPGLLKRLFD